MKLTDIHSIPYDVVTHSDPLVVLIRAHLYLEAMLALHIENNLHGPFPSDRLNFPMKVELASALGGFPPQAKAPLLTINRLRNKFAHNVHAQLEHAEAEQLRGQLSFLSSINHERWPEFTPAAKIGLMAAVFQAFLAGAVEGYRIYVQQTRATLHAAAVPPTSDAEIMSKALELYPDPA